MKFRKKPVVIDAIQFDGTYKRAIEIRDWIGDACAMWHYAEVGNFCASLSIDTLEGQHRAAPGDWIIKGVKGEFYPCKPDIFEITYEPAEGD